MLVSVIPIGNSRGIRIPKSIIQQLKIEDQVELEVHDKELHLRPVNRQPRENWSEAFEKMHEYGEDAQLLDENLTESDEFQWEW